MPDVPFRVALLKKMHLFHGISEAQLTTIAQSMEEAAYEEDDELICRQGTKTDFLYIIYNGDVTIYTVVKGKEVRLTSLFRGDYFGEQSLINNSYHNATVRAKRGTVLLKLPRKEFIKLLRKIRHLKQNFIIMIKSRELARKLKFSWLNENEVIYYISRIHYLWLLQKLIAPAILLLILGGVSGFLFSISQNLPTLLLFEIILAILLMFAILLWGAWRYFDWKNDYHIITNHRVIHITRTIAVYDFRSEIRMDMIVSVDRDTGLIGRFVNFGTVVVRTVVGKITMHLVRYPHQMVVMINEYISRTKDVRQVQDERAIKDIIRKKIGHQPLGTGQAPASEPSKKTKKTNLIQKFPLLFYEIFEPRKEIGGTVTYHKHWVALLRTAAAPSLLLMGLFGLGTVLYRILPGMVLLPAYLIWALFFIGVFVWWLYRFIDWRNDIYQVTPEQVVVIQRVPLGREDRQNASLDKILSINYERRGIWELLLSYGTVNIRVGDVDFSFTDVAEPAHVQNDIQQRITHYHLRKQAAEVTAERERMAEWLAMYHKTMSEIEKQADQPHNPKSG